MAGHRPFSELRATIEADPARAARLAAAEQQLAMEQAEYNQVLTDIGRARGYAQEQLARALDVPHSHVTRIEQQTSLYLSTLQSYLAAMGGTLELVAGFDDSRVTLALTDIFPVADPVDEAEHVAAQSTR